MNIFDQVSHLQTDLQAANLRVREVEAELEHLRRALGRDEEQIRLDLKLEMEAVVGAELARLRKLEAADLAIANNYCGCGGPCRLHQGDPPTVFAERAALLEAVR